MNKIIPGKGNMYEFITHTWNPMRGECIHKCPYCSTHKLANIYPMIAKKYSGPPELDKSVNDDLGCHKVIFVCGQSDLFAESARIDSNDSVPGELIERVLEQCNKYPNNKYFFQTKNPFRLLSYIGLLPMNSKVCTTIESDRYYEKFSGDTHSPFERMLAMEKIIFDKYVTIEPLMDFDLMPMIEIIKRCNPIQVNIGADSGKNSLPEPDSEKIEQLIIELQKFTIIHKKSNLKRLL